MGTKNDMKRRIKKGRIDSKLRQGWIERACGWIFEDGDAVDGKAVNDLLNRESLAPTRVSVSIYCVLLSG